MSGFYNPSSSAEEEYHHMARSQAYQLPNIPYQQPLPLYDSSLFTAPLPYNDQIEYYQPSTQYPTSTVQPYQGLEPSSWIPDQPSNLYSHSNYTDTFPQYTETWEYRELASSRQPAGYLSPEMPARGRISRATSFASNASSVHSGGISQSDASRSASPNANEMSKWGFKNGEGSWSCAYLGCASRSTFTRGCDLRKHYKRHSKSLFCRHEGCPQATEGGFSSKKDRARHEAKHNPSIVCDWEGCERLFSRQDNMKDHVRRVHRKKTSTSTWFTSMYQR